jgi:hypothetical protein
VLSNVSKLSILRTLTFTYGHAVSALRRAFAEVKQRWSVIGWVTKNLLPQAPCFGRHVKPIVPAAFAVVSPFSVCVIHKEGLCLNSGDINTLMMMYYNGLGSNLIHPYT